MPFSSIVELSEIPKPKESHLCQAVVVAVHVRQSAAALLRGEYVMMIVGRTSANLLFLLLVQRRDGGAHREAHPVHGVVVEKSAHECAGKWSL